MHQDRSGPSVKPWRSEDDGTEHHKRWVKTKVGVEKQIHAGIFDGSILHICAQFTGIHSCTTVLGHLRTNTQMEFSKSI